jgi:hypothetical protein
VSFQQENGMCFIDFGSILEYSKSDDELVYVLVFLFEIFDLNSGYFSGVSEGERVFHLGFEFVPVGCIVVVDQRVFPFLGKESGYPSFHFRGDYSDFTVGVFHVVEFQVKLHDSPPVGKFSPLPREDSWVSDESCIGIGCFGYGGGLFLGILPFGFLFGFRHL